MRPHAPTTPSRTAADPALSLRAGGALRLTREVRLPLRPVPGGDWCFELRLRVTVSGSLQADTGYLYDARLLEEWVLTSAGLACGVDLASFSPERLLAALWSQLQGAEPAGLTLVELDLSASTPWRWTRCAEAPGPLLTGRFHFCAAHRLHLPRLSDEENRRLFGPCNNPAGHGHDYALEVTAVAARAGGEGAVRETLERAVAERVLGRFDHRHLNVDVPELANLNPTVEVVASLIWDLLDAALPERALWAVRLHETPKICAEQRQG
jgi:6-pyruvoyl-tetrahydropterin synthase